MGILIDLPNSIIVSQKKSRISCSGLLLCRLVFLGHGGISLLLRTEIFWQVMNVTLSFGNYIKMNLKEKLH